jgi:hypothetical protein
MLTANTAQACKPEIKPTEMLAISNAISRRYAPKPDVQTPGLFLLPVDPYHLYAYWNSGKAPILGFNNNRPGALIVRIYWRPDANPDIKRSNVWFDVAADHPTGRQKIPLPLDASAYSAALGKLKPDQSFHQIAVSNLIFVPPASTPVKIAPLPPIHSHSIAQPPATPLDQPSPFTFSDQNWCAKLHFRQLSAGVNIRTQLSQFFNQPGITVELIAETALYEAPPTASCQNASGQSAC